MESTSCDYCRLPFKVRRVTSGQPNYCCTGCALASQVPVNDKGDFPVNGALLSALGTGFVFFNQVLFWGLAVLLARQENVAMAERFLWLASAAAWLLFFVVVGLVIKSRAGRAGDWALMLGVLAVYGLAHRHLPPEPIGMAVASAAMLLWNTRGYLRKKLV